MSRYKTMVGHASYEDDFDKQLEKFEAKCIAEKLEITDKHFTISGMSLAAVFEYRSKPCQKKTTKKKAV